jgi:hypothetical protein
LYQVTFRGRFDEGGAVLFAGNGIIAGMDVGEVKYDGTYTTGSNGGLAGTVNLKATKTTQLAEAAMRRYPEAFAIKSPWRSAGGFGG